MLFDDKTVDEFTRGVISFLLMEHKCRCNGRYSCNHINRAQCIEKLMRRFQEKKRLDNDYNDMRRLVEEWNENHNKSR